MKFIYAKLDVREIERRVREEQCRTGKRVTEVLLTGAEWCEFMRAVGPNGHGLIYQFYLRGPMPQPSCLQRDCMCIREETVDVITVRPQ